MTSVAGWRDARHNDPLTEGATVSARKEVKSYIKANKRWLVYRFAGLYLFQNSIARVKTFNDFNGRPEIRPIQGVTASIENATGMAHGSVLADAWITIDGPDFQWIVKVRTGSPWAARKFVAAVNTVSRSRSRSTD